MALFPCHSACPHLLTPPPDLWCRRTGVSIEVIPETPYGDIDLTALASLLDGRRLPVLVCVSHVPTSSGGCVAGVAEWGGGGPQSVQ